MTKPLVCFLSFNRAGSSALNLKALLDTQDDFDLIIVDNASSDGIWEYIQSVKDHRIIIKHQFPKNYGVVYALNYALSKRDKSQPFIHVENDVWIKEPKWIKKFEDTLNSFPNLGLIGAVSQGHFETKLNNLKKSHSNNSSCYYSNLIMGCCNYLTPEVINLIGYWNEECCGADKEIAPRINLCTEYKTAYTGNFTIEFRNQIPCDACPLIDMCKFERKVPCECCRIYYPNLYTHKSFSSIANSKTSKFLHELQNGTRTAFSASIHDTESLNNNYYDYDSANENFDFFSSYNL